MAMIFMDGQRTDALDWLGAHPDGHVLVVGRGNRRTLHDSARCIHLRAFRNPNWKLIGRQWFASLDREELVTIGRAETGQDPYSCPDCSAVPVPA